MVVAVRSSLLFFSLPELRLIGCPIVLEETKNDKKGTEISVADAETGEVYTYTLPCGAVVPDGAVCSCNCVKGSVCSCVGYKKGSGSDGSHYWHPN